MKILKQLPSPQLMVTKNVYFSNTQERIGKILLKLERNYDKTLKHHDQMIKNSIFSLKIIHKYIVCYTKYCVIYKLCKMPCIL